MKTITLILFLISSQINIAQSDTLYIMVEKPIFGSNCYGATGTGFSLVSKDKNYYNDYFAFTIQNAKGIDEKGDFEYYTLKETRKKIDVSTISHETILSLSKNKEWWEIHNAISLYKKIYLLEKKENTEHNKNNNVLYFIMPMKYEGTRKNIIPTDLSFRKD